VKYADESDGELDSYGNPVSGDRVINCCFPDCGCDGSRLCMAENGANSASCALNFERGSYPFSRKQEQGR